jgi:integrase
VPKREPDPLTTVAGFLTEYVSRRVDVKPATKEVWSQVTRNLLEHFGGQRDLRMIDETAAEDFKLFLLKADLASTTVAKRLQFARQFFKAAVKRRLIPSNPFADVGAKATMKDDRERFVTREETDRLLEACPNIDWRVIVALCRFGGLRCPSEVLTLEWVDVDWQRGRFRAHSPKTEHHPGKASRVIPLFPELRAILEEAWELAPEGAVYVVGNDSYRQAADTPGGWRNCNLRTQFGRILKRAGLEPWPRLFHALRASRETELAAEYPVHVVTAWLGNTPKIAMKHYLMTTESDFSKAMGRLVEKAVQNPVQSNHNSGAKSGAAACRSDSQEVAENDISRCETTAYAKSCDDLPRPAKIISGEDRIRTCGPVTQSRI